MAERLRYIPALDGLRALAVLAVVIGHSTPPSWLPGGWLGVDLFFVLSGYLITRILDDELRASGRISLWRFYARRALRLAPALLALVAACVGLAVAGLFPTIEPWLVRQQAVLAATYTMNWGLALRWTVDSGPLGHTWSLAAEEQFYLIWPALFLLVRGRWRVGLLLAAAVGALAWRIWLDAQGASVLRLYYPADTHSDGLIIGCLLALAPRIPARGGWFALAAFAAGVRLLHFGDEGYNVASITLAALIGAWLVSAATGAGSFARVMAWRPLVALGKISYGVYLYHYAAMVLVTGLLGKPWAPVGSLLGIGVAILSYRYLERPFLSLKSRFEPPAAGERVKVLAGEGA
jgi:peptidoglycan/LPS O-acetylase OafA/YrhL